ncbi:hypothetical protein CHS0354_017546 [Potamilus streckersoni]|uniref:Uncharacterized protein n=1 Tax=Potamilus streckersoni TaxID=2493646 RepID=A0AAE0TGS3_9BIVA|nr:hypothetical protein CHS0354_017546 [Potamilus streckersoni]
MESPVQIQEEKVETTEMDTSTPILPSKRKRSTLTPRTPSELDITELIKEDKNEKKKNEQKESAVIRLEFTLVLVRKIVFDFIKIDYPSHPILPNILNSEKSPPAEDAHSGI